MERNVAERGVAIYSHSWYDIRMVNCNLLFNSADSTRSAIYARLAEGRTELEACIVAYNLGRPPVEDDSVFATCSNVYGHT